MISERSPRCESRCSSSARTRTRTATGARCGPPTEPGWRSSPTRTIFSGEGSPSWERPSPHGCAVIDPTTLLHRMRRKEEASPPSWSWIRETASRSSSTQIRNDPCAFSEITLPPSRWPGVKAMLRTMWGSTLGARPALRERAIVAAVAIAVLLLLGLAGCSRTPAPVMELSDDAVPGLIEVELRERAAVPGKVVDQAEQEDDLYGDALSPEYDVELEVKPGTEAEVLAQLRARPDVIWAEPVVRYQATWIPDDPDFSKQWHLKAAGAERAWDATRGEGVTVAVIDTGIYPVDDLDPGRIVKGWNFVGKNDDARDDHAHGTHVAGTVAQSTGNGKGVAGMAPQARLMPVKVLSAFGSGTSHDIAEGIRWAVDHGARVLNLSLGGGARSLAMESAVAYARRGGAGGGCAAGKTRARGGADPAPAPRGVAARARRAPGRPPPVRPARPPVA